MLHKHIRFHPKNHISFWHSFQIVYLDKSCTYSNLFCSLICIRRYIWGLFFIDPCSYSIAIRLRFSDYNGITMQIKLGKVHNFAQLYLRCFQICYIKGQAVPSALNKHSNTELSLRPSSFKKSNLGCAKDGWFVQNKVNFNQKTSIHKRLELF